MIFDVWFDLCVSCSMIVVVLCNGSIGRIYFVMFWCCCLVGYCCYV